LRTPYAAARESQTVNFEFNILKFNITSNECYILSYIRTILSISYIYRYTNESRNNV